MTTKDSPFMEKYLTPIAVLLGAIIIALAFAFGTGTERPAPGEEAGAADISAVEFGDAPVLGSASAPVTMAVWFDYQCPFCKRYELETMEQVYENYVVTGKVKVVLMDYQFLGPDSDDAALFARAVWEAYPERFHDWYKAVMTAQDEEHGGFGNTDSIVTLTKSLGGIDTDRVLALADQKKAEYQADIAAARQEGSSIGINGTPGTLIGTKILSGAVPYTQVSAALDAELAK